MALNRNRINNISVIFVVENIVLKKELDTNSNSS